jgi:hypothetical protein
MRFLFIVTGFFMFFASNAIAMDVECIKNNFDKYISAREEFQKYPLQFIKDQPTEVQKAVTEEVEYQLANVKLEKSILSVLIDVKKDLEPSLSIGHIFSTYLEQNCEQTTPDRCAMYSLLPNDKMKKIYAGNKDFEDSLKKFNSINRNRMKESDLQKKERLKNRDVVYKKIYSDMMKTDAAKIGQDLGSKKLSELGCEI